MDTHCWLLRLFAGCWLLAAGCFMPLPSLRSIAVHQVRRPEGADPGDKFFESPEEDATIVD